MFVSQSRSGTLTADGIKVNPAGLPSSPVSTVNNIGPDPGTTNITLDADDVHALPIDGSTPMEGVITFDDNQTFPGTVTKVNNTVTPDSNGELTLTASDVGAVPSGTGGSFGGNISVDGTISATGNISTDGKLLGDGSQITNLPIPATLRFKGNTNINGDAPSAVAGNFYLNLVAGTGNPT